MSEVGASLADAALDTPGLGEVARKALAASLLEARLDLVVKQRFEAGAPGLAVEDEEAVRDAVLAHLGGLGEIERLLASDPTIENINADGHDTVWVEYNDGRKASAEPIAASDDHLADLVRLWAATEGHTERRFDAAQPSVTFRLRDGSRLTAVHRALAGRTVVQIRRFSEEALRADVAWLARRGTVNALLASLLPALVRARRSIVVTGDTDAGKTTSLRALINEIPAEERVILVEDDQELQPPAERHPDMVELECRNKNIEGEGEVTMRGLCRLALRLNGDRVIVGEVRGPEILDMFQAMTHNRGSMGTVHARSAEHGFQQMRRYAVRGPEQLTFEAAALDIASSVNFVVHVEKLPGGRRVVSAVHEVVGYDGAAVLSNEVLGPDRWGRAVPTGVGLQDDTQEALAAAGHDLALWRLPDGGWTQ
ncbi:MAG: CpaF family protein [Acidimicrobiales bacterium]